VFLENVSRRAFPEPLHDLQRLGFECAPPCVATSQNFGAPHVRERWFLLAAHPDRPGLQERQGPAEASRNPRAAGDRGNTANANGVHLRHEPGRRSGPNGTGPRQPGDDRPLPTDSDSGRLESEWCGWVFDEQRQTLRHDADRCNLRCRIRGSHWATQSPPVRVAHGLPNRVDRIRSLGNSVVPAVVAEAFRTLVGCLPQTKAGD
jgi:DNA (cytosine-5)-methyltransferase 1